MIVGLGSAGSALALMAARAGVGHFSLIDNGVLNPEHVGRHFCTSIGTTKVQAVKELIWQVNPGAVVSTYEQDFRKLVHEGFSIDGHISLLIGTTDSFECQSLLNMLSLETHIPSLFVGCWGAATVGEILYVKPGLTPCYNCYAGFRRAEEPVASASRKYFDPDFDSTRTPSQPGLWSNILTICGFAFQVVLALVGHDQAGFMGDKDNLFLVNVGDCGSGLPFWAVSRGFIDRGCGVCEG